MRARVRKGSTDRASRIASAERGAFEEVVADEDDPVVTVLATR
jgi:hypothetical protein